MLELILAAAAAVAAPAAAVPPPIIDVHLHARRADYAGENPPPMCAPFEAMPYSDNRVGVYEGMGFVRPPCADPIPAETTDEAVMAATLTAMERHNIYGVVSGEPALMARWIAAGPKRIMPALDYRLPGTPGARHVAARTLDELRREHAAGRLMVIGEIMAQYEGVPLDEPRLDPLWALAVELDVPVAIHMGPGEPGQPYAGGGYRAALGDPLTLEPVLVKHPRLRVLVMHAGYPLGERLRALMFTYPQVYADVGVIVYTQPRASFYAFLRGLVEDGYGDRILFGSDQMIWPGVIPAAIRTIEEAPFLSADQKRDIFYNNAVRFLRLPESEQARHRAGR